MKDTWVNCKKCGDVEAIEKHGELICPDCHEVVMSVDDFLRGRAEDAQLEDAIERWRQSKDPNY